MKPKPQYQPPLQGVLFAWTRRMLDETALNAQSFAMALADQYLALTAPDVRSVPFRLGDDPAADMRHNGQILRRYMDGTVKVLPADLVDAWVLSLPEPYRGDCERDLARRRGRMSFEIPPADAMGADVIAPVLVQAGELFAVWGRAIADKTITPAELREIVNESSDVIGAVLRAQQFAVEQSAKGGEINA